MLRLALVAGIAACSFGSPPDPVPAIDDPDAPPAMPSMIQWLGDLHVRSNGYAVPPTQVLAGQPVDVCVRTYPMGAAANATLAIGGRELAMRVDADGVGPYGHDTRWCAALDAADLVAGRPLALRAIAADAAGAPVEAVLDVTPRAELALLDEPALWRMAGPGSFARDGDLVRAQPADGLGLYWAAIPTPADFELAIDWQLDRSDDNSGVFVRFRDPDGFGYDNPAWVGVHDGLEIQIDDTARPDGADIHRTGAVYEQPGTYTRPADRPPGTWRQFVIRVTGARVAVALDGQPVSDVTFAGDPAHPQRALPSVPGAPRFVGLQTHSGAVAFRRVLLRAL